MRNRTNLTDRRKTHGVDSVALHQIDIRLGDECGPMFRKCSVDRSLSQFRGQTVFIVDTLSTVTAQAIATLVELHFNNDSH